LTDIKRPIKVMMTIFQSDTPSDTPARSCADTWPDIATAATDMPILANCPTKIGQAKAHSARTSSRKTG
jgi:hypothetical protein